MRFYEYEAKALFARHGTPLLRGRVARTATEAAEIAQDLAVPVVLKSQVLTGGRMKAGGVKFADTPAEAEAAARAILALEIRGQKLRGVLVEERASVASEYFAAVTWDGRRKLPVLVFSDMGGIDIEEVAEQHPEHVGQVHVSALLPFTPYKAKEAIAAVGVSGEDLNRLTPIVATLVEIFLRYDLTLAEINPLGKTRDGRFLVLDGHVDLEGDARDKHVTLLQEIGAGGGSLTLFDAIRRHGGRPANYCEIGGNPSVRKACELTKLILSKPGVKKIAVMMNVVSNTRVDIVARGVIKGCVEAGRNPADTIAIFRIPGAWEDDGFKILRKYGVEYCDRSVSMYEAAGRAVAKLKG